MKSQRATHSLGLAHAQANNRTEVDRAQKFYKTPAKRRGSTGERVGKQFQFAQGGRMNPFESIARNLARCIVTGDAEGLRALFHSDATAWHNVTEREIDVDGIVASAQVLVPIPEFNYTDSKLTCFSTGVVIEHVVTGRSPNGAAFAMPACIVLEIENGLIRRLREWFDSVQSERARNPD